jgi:TRAP-type C4-dicarboxylate transport system substrate-binding protein
VLSVLLALVVACSGDVPETSVTVVETSQAPTTVVNTTAVESSDSSKTLHLAVTSGFANDQVEALVHELDEVSDGALQIEINEERGDAGVAVDVEQQVVAATASGELDLGWVGTRALAELGVASFDVLTAPMLIDSYALETAVLDSDLPGRMLEGLEPLGVIGMAVIGGRLRMPIGVDGPFTNPDSFSGATIHAFHSAWNTATLEALGAIHADVSTDGRDQGLEDGTIDGYENNVGFFETRLDIAPYMTLNLRLWPGTGVLFANPGMLAGLTETQSQWLTEAVDRIASESVEIANTDDDLIDGICDAGGRFAIATDSELEDLRSAVEPVYLLLTEDEETAEYLTVIEALGLEITDQPPAVPSGCSA